jgi:CRP/FNR family transcriptional regulator, cyclic AMP receptor protein
MNNLEKALALRSAPLFASLSADAILPVAALCHQVDLVAGQVLFEAGEVGDSLFVVVSGCVLVKRGSELVARLGAGECVGEMGALDLEPRSATVAAAEPTRLIRLERNDLMDILTDYPEIMRNLATMLVERIRRASG